MLRIFIIYAMHIDEKILLVYISHINVAADLSDLTIFWIFLLLVPFGRVVEPSHKEGSQRCSVGEDEECINSPFSEVSMYDSHKLMDSYSHIEGALAKRESCIEFSKVIYLSFVLHKLVWIELSPSLVGN